MVWVVSRFRLKVPPGISSSRLSPLTSSGQRSRASWASQPQKSATLSPQPGGKPRKFIRTCGGTGGGEFGVKLGLMVRVVLWMGISWYCLLLCIFVLFILYIKSRFICVIINEWLATVKKKCMCSPSEVSSPNMTALTSAETSVIYLSKTTSRPTRPESATEKTVSFSADGTL